MESEYFTNCSPYSSNIKKRRLLKGSQNQWKTSVLDRLPCLQCAVQASSQDESQHADLCHCGSKYSILTDASKSDVMPSSDPCLFLCRLQWKWKTCTHHTQNWETWLTWFKLFDIYFLSHFYDCHHSHTTDQSLIDLLTLKEILCWKFLSVLHWTKWPKWPNLQGTTAVNSLCLPWLCPLSAIPGSFGSLLLDSYSPTISQAFSWIWGLS